MKHKLKDCASFRPSFLFARSLAIWLGLRLWFRWYLACIKLDVWFLCTVYWLTMFVWPAHRETHNTAQWALASRAVSSSPPNPRPKCTMRNCETGDLSLIIRFTFYAFQMINANERSYDRQQKNCQRNLSCELFNPRVYVIRARALVRIHTAQKLCCISAVVAAAVYVYNFRFIYIHH